MTTEQAIKSGFFKEFIAYYSEHQIHDLIEGDKVRLMYVLCESDSEKREMTKIKIENIKSQIRSFSELENLSVEYIKSCDPQHPWYIENDKRQEYWISKFAESFCYNLNDLDIISKGYPEFCKAFEDRFESQDGMITEFWEVYENFKPLKSDVAVVVRKEGELIDMIVDDIKRAKKEKGWDFEIHEYKRYISYSVWLKSLFDHCELLVCLHNLEMFKSFLNIPTFNDAVDKDKNWFKVGLLFATGEMDSLRVQFSNNSTKIAKHLENTSYRPYISESISKTNVGDKNIFSNQERLQQILKHCNQNNLPVVVSFMEHIKNK